MRSNSLLCAACHQHPMAHRALCVHCFFKLPHTTQREYEQRHIGTLRAINLLDLGRSSVLTFGEGKPR